MQIACQANALARSYTAKQSPVAQEDNLQHVLHKQRVQQHANKHQQQHQQQQQQLHPNCSPQQATSPQLPPLPPQHFNRPSQHPLSQRRALLLSGIAAGACLIPVSSSQAAVTVTLRPKAQLKPYTLKAGYSVTVPDSWGLAYDRSLDEKSGTQAFFGNFRTFETLAISKLAKPEGDYDPKQLLDWVMADQRNNQSTYDFMMLSGDTPTQRTAPVSDAAGSSGAEDVYFESEYLLAICRGLIQEGSRGSRRCIGPRDMDLEVVSRTFYQSFTVRGDSIYIIRGSSTSPQWQDVRAAALEAVQSFRLPAEMQ